MTRRGRAAVRGEPLSRVFYDISQLLESGEESERSMPNVLLSDIAMPGETGHDLMRKIVAREGDGAPPAAALSAYTQEQDLAEALASGFRMLLSKPIDPGALIAAVAALAGTSGDDCARHRAESRRS